MQFSIDRKIISAALLKIQGITGRKTNISMTSDVLIKTSGSELTITANNFETVFNGIYHADIESDGIVSINAKKFFEIIREYPDKDVRIKYIDDRFVEIVNDNIVFKILRSDMYNFPETPVINDMHFVEVDSVHLKKMIDVASSVRVGKDENRIHFLGALIENIDDSHIRIVSTDSKRLNYFDIDYNGKFISPENPIVVPKNGLSELTKLIPVEGVIEICVKDNHFIVRRQNETIMIKLLSCDYFPDYRRAIGIDSMIPIEIDRSLFLMVMKRMSILASDDYKSAIFNFKDNELVVTITNPGIGDSKEEILISYTGDDIETAFNPRYFIDALNIIESSHVYINIRDNKSPCILRGIDDDRMICTIMPRYF